MAKQNKSEVNQSILNIITPSGLEFNKTKMILSDNYAKIVVISKYDMNPDYGWISDITAIEGVTAAIEFRPTDSGKLIERSNEQIRQYRLDLSTIKEESELQAKEKAIDDISEMIKRINQEGEVVGYLNILLLIQASSEKNLDDRMKRVVSLVTSHGCSVRNLTFYQKKAYKCVAPYGMPDETISDIGERNMPISTFIGGFPNASSGIKDQKGYYLGKTDKGKQIILDTWKRGGDRTNSNWVILGLPGVGKSATVKDIVLREYALGSKIIFLDPEREYVDLTKNLKGDVINCGGGKGGKLNPLQIRVSPKIESEDEENDEMYKDEGNGLTDVANYYQTLRTFFRLYLRNVTDMQLAKLEEILEELYRNFNITWTTDIRKMEPEQFPVMKDLYDLVCEKAEQSNDQDIKDLKLLLRSCAVGADSFLWNGYTDIKSDAEIIDLDISSLLESDEKVQKAQYYNILSYCWQRIALNRTEKILLVVDEAYLMVDPEVPQSLIFLRNISKRIRKYEGGLIVISHALVDFLDPEVKRHGQAIMDNSCFKFLMGTDGQNLEESKKLFKLTEKEVALLLSKQRGKGILFAGSNRISLKIEIPEEFLHIMGSAGGR